MRIICPTCASHYEIEAARITAGGQLVRCARCRDVWLVRPPKERTASEASPAIVQAPPAGDAPPADSGADVIDFHDARVRLRPREREGAGRRDWATSFSVIAVGATLLASVLGLQTVRGAVADHVPGAARMFATLGLPTRTEHLALEDVSSRLVEENHETVLQLQGRISNTGAKAEAVPDLTVVVRSDGELPLYTYTATAPKPQLAHGESVAFQSRLASPPPGGHDVRVSLGETAAR